MDRVEYRVEDNKYPNRLGLSIKRPEHIRRKWSEDDIRIKCSECESEELDMDLSGELLVITCLECSNFWHGSKDDVLYWSKDEQAIASVRRIEQFEEIE